MKRNPTGPVRWPIAVLALAAFCCIRVHAHDLRLEVTPVTQDAPLPFDKLTLTNATGQAFSVTRLDFLLSNFSLRRSDGTWLARTNGQAYLSPREGRTGFKVEGIPAGSYDRARFLVGVTRDLNHADPAQFGPTHPLNPNVNGLHWNWQGGYVFLALEGRWRDTSGAWNGYSFHLATDRLLTTVELPLALELKDDRELQLKLSVDKIFAGPHLVKLDADHPTTHSREGDALAEHLQENLVGAFSFSPQGKGGNVLAPSDSRLRAEFLRRGVSGPLSAGERNGGRGKETIEASHASAPAKFSISPLVATNATPYGFTYPADFPQPALPLDNPLTEEGVTLGRALFSEPRLSRNNAQSCASCHDLRAAGSQPGQRFSTGVDGVVGPRNAMPLFNLAWKNSFFWDGRAPSLRAQVLEPIQNPIEMHETLSNVVAKLQSPATNAAAANYPALFARAFGTPEISADRLARALEQFLLTQVSGNAKFDRALRGEAELTEVEKRGFELFVTEYDPRRGLLGADCFHCHGGPLFVNLPFANNGLDRAPSDLGRYLTTRREGDQGRFSVPSLRNVALTGPYMHDGRFKTLAEVVEFYSSGVQRGATLDPNLAKHPEAGLRLATPDREALVAFLQTLTDERLKKPDTAQEPDETASP